MSLQFNHYDHTGNTVPVESEQWIIHTARSSVPCLKYHGANALEVVHAPGCCCACIRDLLFTSGTYQRIIFGWAACVVCPGRTWWTCKPWNADLRPAEEWWQLSQLCDEVKQKSQGEREREKKREKKKQLQHFCAEDTRGFFFQGVVCWILLLSIKCVGLRNK